MLSDAGWTWYPKFRVAEEIDLILVGDSLSDTIRTQLAVKDGGFDESLKYAYNVSLHRIFHISLQSQSSDGYYALTWIL